MDEEPENAFFEYTAPETAEEADTDLALALSLALKCIEACVAQRPYRGNTVATLRTLEGVRHHVARAASMVAWIRNGSQVPDAGAAE